MKIRIAKSVADFTALFLLLSILTAIALGTATAQSVSVEPDSVTDLCSGDDPFAVTIVVDSDEYNLQSVKLDLIYDSDALEVISVTDNGLLGTLFTNYFVEGGSGDNGEGMVHFGVTKIGMADSPVNGDFITINFQIKAEASDDTYDLELVNVELRENPTTVISNVNLNNGQVVVDCDEVDPDDPVPSVAVSPDQITGYCPDDGPFSVTIEVNSDTYNLQSVCMDLLYNPDAMEMISITNNGLLGTLYTDYFVEGGSGLVEEGRIHYGVTKIGMADSPVNGDFITISFQLKEGISDGTYDLNFENVELRSDPTTIIPDVQKNDGDVIVADCDIDCQCEYCLDLIAGLNLVSLPKKIVGDNDAATIFDIDGTKGEYCYYYNPAIPGYETNPDVKPCRGYWVFKSEPMQVCVDFDVSSLPSQQLYEGWNMIGHIHTTSMEVFDFAAATGLEEDGTLLFRQLNTYSQSTGYSYYHMDDFDSVYSGVGYLVLMKQDTVMYGMQ